MRCSDAAALLAMSDMQGGVMADSQKMMPAMDVTLAGVQASSGSLAAHWHEGACGTEESAMLQRGATV